MHFKLWYDLHFADKKARKDDLPSHSIKNNHDLWNNYDWSQGGDEWSKSERWKIDLVQNMMGKYFSERGDILEIGPGAGRWSFYLKDIGKKLILADISPKCLEICRQRFVENQNIQYELISSDLSFIPDNSIDYIWSYDVFVHINPSDIENYLKDFRRIMKQNGIGIIHHSGDHIYDKNAFRAKMSASRFKDLTEANGLKVIEQNTTLVHLAGDLITVLQR